jgi:hypothetical protein
MPFPRLQIENQNDNSKTKLFAFFKDYKEQWRCFLPPSHRNLVTA